MKLSTAVLFVYPIWSISDVVLQLCEVLVASGNKPAIFGGAESDHVPRLLYICFLTWGTLDAIFISPQARFYLLFSKRWCIVC